MKDIMIFGLVIALTSGCAHGRKKVGGYYKYVNNSKVTTTRG